MSVGGGTYPFPTRMSQDKIQGIIKYVDQYELDGIDLDYENNPKCKLRGNVPACQTDTALTNLIQDFGQALEQRNKQNGKKKILLSAAPFSVGAFNYGHYVNAKPQSSYSGMWVNPLKKAGDYLDIINIMSYDAGPYTFDDTRFNHAMGYNPLEAYHAYRDIFKGKINVGIEIPPEGWGKNVVTPNAINEIAKGID